MHRCLTGAVSAEKLIAPGSRQAARHDCCDRTAATVALTQFLQNKPGIFSSLNNRSLLRQSLTETSPE